MWVLQWERTVVVQGGAPEHGAVRHHAGLNFSNFDRVTARHSAGLFCHSKIARIHKTNVVPVLAQPAGEWAVLGIGLVSIAGGLSQFFEAFTARFKKDLKREEMTKAEEDFVFGLGRVGYLARGITFTLVGWFVFQAGMQHDASKVKGFAGTFMFLLGQPYGHLLLGLVALGFIALGVHSFAAARWMRLLGSRQ